MTEEEQQQAKQRFFEKLNKENAIIENEVFNHIQSYHLASVVREYLSLNSPITQATKKLNGLIGEKVTIVKFNDFGFPVVFNTVIDKVENKPYAQYNEALWLTHKPKRKRNLYRNIILPNESILVYLGWLNIDMNKLIYNTTQENELITVQQSKYHSFDRQYLHDVIEQYGEPFIKLL